MLGNTIIPNNRKKATQKSMINPILLLLLPSLLLLTVD
jgi:hypothetical protein